MSKKRRIKELERRVAELEQKVKDKPRELGRVGVNPSNLLEDWYDLVNYPPVFTEPGVPKSTYTIPGFHELTIDCGLDWTKPRTVSVPWTPTYNQPVTP